MQFAPGTVTIGKSLSGIGAATPGTYDFVLSFNYDRAGKPIRGTTSVFFTKVGSDQTYLPTSANSTDAPEPATWALMLLGVGAIGVAMRRRATGQYRVSYS